MNTGKRPADKIGAGKSIVNRHERSFARGTLMFIEGEASTEMFIIRSGKVRILRQEGEHAVELARLGPGSVLGELSLLDHQPRGATAQVLEDTTVTVIDEELFTRTMKSIPPWLEHIIRLVVKRLRDTMKKTVDDMVRKSVGGVVQIMLLQSAAANGVVELRLSSVKDQAAAVIGIGGLELENIFLALILRELIFIRKEPSGQEFIVLRDRNILTLYLQYLRMHQRGGVLVGESFGTREFELVQTLLEAGENSGATIPGNLRRVTEQQLELVLTRNGKERFINRDALDTLLESKLVALRNEETVTTHGHHGKKAYLFNPELLRNVAALEQWLPVFNEEIRF